MTKNPLVPPAGAAFDWSVAAVVCALLTLLAYRFPWAPTLPAMWWFGITGIPLVQADLVSHRLPHSLVGAMFFGGLPLLGYASLAESGIGALLRGLVVASVLYIGTHLAASRGAVGGGDANLLGAVGLYLGQAGWEEVLAGLAVAVGLAGCTSLALVALGRVTARDPIAVGPAIFGGALTALILQ